jgi:flagellar M-ring protein FliF
MLQQLIQLRDQLIGIWKQLGLNQRIIVSAAGIGIFAGLMGIAYWSGQTQYALLYGNLSLKELDTIRNQLDSATISHKVGARGNSILVPSDQVHDARIYLAGKGLPNKGDKVGLEIFDRPSFGLSNMQQRVNHTRAIQGELSKTITQMAGVEAAHVMVVMPESRLFVDNQSQASSSVFLEIMGMNQIPKEQVRAIQFLVSSAVEGLVPDRVSVTDSRGQLLSDEPGDDTLTFLSDRQLESRQQLESYLSRKAEDMLTRVLGPGQAIVRVSAEINRETITRSDIIYDPETVPRTTSEITETTITQAPSLVSTNNPPSLASGKTMDRTTKDNEFAVGSQTNDFVQVAGGLKRITAAVFVAMKKDAEKVSISRTPEELQSIERIVSRALGITNSVENLTVEEIEFHADGSLQQPLALQEKPSFSVWRNHSGWVTLGKQIGLLLLTLGVLWVFVRTFKKTPVETIPIGVPLDSMDDFMGGRGGNGGGRGRSNFSIHEPMPPDERIEAMNRLIKENPENMTHAIQSWLQEDTANSN